MNITGYKNKKKSIKRLIEAEKDKKHPFPGKLTRLERSKNNCNDKIRELQKVKHPKRMFKKKQKTKKIKR